MTVGFPIDAMGVNSAAGRLSRAIEEWATETLTFKQYLDATPDDTLEAPPFNFTADDVALLKSGFADLALLAHIYRGEATIDPARDLGVFSRRMAGLLL